MLLSFTAVLKIDSNWMTSQIEGMWGLEAAELYVLFWESRDLQVFRSLMAFTNHVAGIYTLFLL
jgi:hypothetical protein